VCKDLGPLPRNHCFEVPSAHPRGSHALALQTAPESVIVHLELKLVVLALFLSTIQSPTDQEAIHVRSSQPPGSYSMGHRGRPLTSEPPESTEARVYLACDSGEIDGFNLLMTVTATILIFTVDLDEMSRVGVVAITIHSQNCHSKRSNVVIGSITACYDEEARTEPPATRLPPLSLNAASDKRP
jgi:hypothetical protein